MNLKTARIIMILIAISLGSAAFFGTPTYGADKGSTQSGADRAESRAESPQGPPFRLMGTVIEKDQERSIAVIKETTSEKQANYKIGDKISDYQIIKILRGRLVLLKNGRLSLLDFPLGSEAEPIIVVSSDERIVNRSALAKKLPGLNAAMEQAFVLPNITSGKIDGFKIVKIKDRALAKMAGLKEKDVIRSVNGKSLNSLLKPLEIYHEVHSKEKIDVEIKRGDEIKNLVYYMN